MTKGGTIMPTLNTYSVHHWNTSNIGFELIDIQPRRQFRQAHLPHADNVPLDDPKFEEKVRDLLKANRDDLVGDKVVVYGEGGREDKSHEAATRLQNAGLTAVYEYPEGLEGWLKHQHGVWKGDSPEPNAA